MSDTATMHIDGASRGNPGKASYAVVLARPGLPVIEEADTIGTTTNNVAEYTALVEGLGLAAELGVKKLHIYSDSELMVKQMNGAYKVKSTDLLDLYREACRLRAQFEKVTITHVRREHNKRADAIGNDALDGKPRKRRAGREESTAAALEDRTAPLVGKGGPISQSPLPSGSGDWEMGSPFPTSGAQEKTAPTSSALRPPKTNVGDSAVRADAIQCLADAAKHWAANGVTGLPPEAVWEQLWSLLDEAGVLKKKK